MNSDHADALVRYAKVYGHCAAAKLARLTGIDNRGMDLAVDSGSGEQPLRIPFEPPLSGAAEAHERLVRMAIDSREALA